MKAAILYSINLDFYEICVGFSLVIDQFRILSMIISTNETTVCHGPNNWNQIFDNNILSRDFFRHLLRNIKNIIDDYCKCAK